jgi:hypothetical protein
VGRTTAGLKRMSMQGCDAMKGVTRGSALLKK